jgi:hypothetical protein
LEGRFEVGLIFGEEVNSGNLFQKNVPQGKGRDLKVGNPGLS